MLECWDDDSVKRPTFAMIVRRLNDLLQLVERTGRQMYVDPSIYASPDEAVHMHTSEITPKHLSVKEEIGRGDKLLKIS